jgi:hypothetical protein
LTRRAVETAAGQSFRPDVDLAERLVRWASALFGNHIFDGVDARKWRFLEVIEGNHALHDARRAHASNATAGAESTRVPRTIGMPYRPADESVLVASRDPFEIDPEKVDRANRAHATIQNALAQYLREKGIEPRSPGPEDPDADLIWESGGLVFVAEVKSTTPVNEERQLRLALGQVLRYRHVLTSAGYPACAVIAAERQPAISWQELCTTLHVLLVWQEALDRIVVDDEQAP